MMSECSKLIEAWFREHHDDGEFVEFDDSVPYSVIGPTSTTKSILFTSKPTVVASTIRLSRAGRFLSLIGRYGLPGRDDVTWMRNMVASHNAVFFGDLDPPDILVFAWLRDQLHPVRMRYLGISDTFIASTGFNISESVTIALSDTERAAIALVETVTPDLPQLIGPQCTDLLRAGRKLEVEAILTGLHDVDAILRIED